MEELKLRYQQLVRAYKRLAYMRNTFVSLSQDSACQKVSDEAENELIVHRDALIKRFEFCYDLTWKYLKLLLKKKHSIDVASPRSVFQECYRQSLLTREQSEAMIDMIDARNQTAHVYDEQMADIVSQSIVVYYEFLSQMIKDVDPKIF